MSDDYTAAGASHRSEDYGLSETNPIITGPDTILYDLSLTESGTRYGGRRQRWSAYFAIPVSGNAQLLADARKAMWDYRKNQLSVKRQDAVLVRDRWAG